MHFNYAFNILRLRNRDMLTYVLNSVQSGMRAEVYLLLEMVRHMIAPVPVSVGICDAESADLNDS